MQITKEGLERAKAAKVPEGITTVMMDIDSIHPICKIMEPHFYECVKESIGSFGLWHPLVLVEVSVEEWEEEAKHDKDMFPPPEGDKQDKFYRIQCGCNRYYALKELGCKEVECIIAPSIKEAQDLCHRLRIDKRWYRWTSWIPERGK